MFVCKESKVFIVVLTRNHEAVSECVSKKTYVGFCYPFAFLSCTPRFSESHYRIYHISLPFFKGLIVDYMLFSALAITKFGLQ